MALTLERIRFMAERYVNDTLSNEDIINWANDINAELGLNINIPDSAQIALTTTDMEYTLPATLKVINRLWLQSDRDNGIDKEFTWQHRIYNGKIIFVRPYWQSDTLNVDFYRQLTYFKAITDPIDLDDRYSPLYTSYMVAQYYLSPSAIERLGELQARKQYEQHYGRYISMRTQVTALYSLVNEPAVVQERW